MLNRTLFINERIWIGEICAEEKGFGYDYRTPLH